MTHGRSVENRKQISDTATMSLFKLRGVLHRHLFHSKNICPLGRGGGIYFLNETSACGVLEENSCTLASLKFKITIKNEPDSKHVKKNQQVP